MLRPTGSHLQFVLSVRKVVEDHTETTLLVVEDCLEEFWVPASWVILAHTRLDLLQLSEDLHEKASGLQHHLQTAVLAIDDLVGPGVGAHQVGLSHDVFRQEHCDGWEVQISLESATASSTEQ